MVAFNPIRPARRRPRFLLGGLYATPGAAEALEAAHQRPMEVFERHQYGDWGEVCPEDARTNEEAVENGNRIMSAYTLSTGVRIWVITEADRSATTILLPDEH